MEHIKELEQELNDLRHLLIRKENELCNLKKQSISETNEMKQGKTEQESNVNNYSKLKISDALSKSAIERYSRQILLPEIGVSGQEKLCSAKVLVVGAGGLGCPAAVYLAGAGIGEIGIIDYDTVDITNIHRQILHSEADREMSKVESAAQKLRRINSQIFITPYNLELTAKNAAEIVSHYDIVLDCTDNVPTRYLLNDVCCLLKIPLISGSALKMEGQITIYCYRSQKNNEMESGYIGPCYRCLFPIPPPPESVGSCSANGVAGPLPGVIGALQALETIKHIVGHGRDKLLVGRMLLFDGEDMTSRTVKLRPKNPQCAVCSNSPTITELVDYETFCNMKAKEKDLDLPILPPENRIKPNELLEKLNSGSIDKDRHMLVDVRSEPEFQMCRISGAINYPIDKFRDDVIQNIVDKIRDGREVTFVCRRGNDSQIAAKLVLDALDEGQIWKINDLIGGLHGWSLMADPEFPIY